MKRLISKSLSSLLCLLLICAFCAPAFAAYPWAEDPPGQRQDAERLPSKSGQEESNLIGLACAEASASDGALCSDWLSSAMFDVSFYVYDLLADGERQDLNTTYESDSRK